MRAKLIKRSRSYLIVELDGERQRFTFWNGPDRANLTDEDVEWIMSEWIEERKSNQTEEIPTELEWLPAGDVPEDAAD